MNPTVSVIVPCYNSALYIAQGLDSLLQQTFEDIEIICVNDGSKDKTNALLAQYANLDFRIKVITQSNQGISEARNTGIRNSTGKYIVFMDSDDWLQPEMIAQLMNAANDRILVCCSYNRVWQDIVKPRNLNLNMDIDAAEIQRRLVGLIDSELKDPSQADSLVTVWGKLYLGDVIRDNAISFVSVSEVGNEDALFNIMYLDCFRPEKQVYVFNRPLYNYRKSGQSFTNRYRQDLPKKWLVLYDRISSIIKEKDSNFKTALNNRICLSIIGLGLNEMSSGEGSGNIRRTLAEILAHPRYKAAFAQLDFSYFPLYWKVFFYAAKYGQIRLLYFILKYIKLRTQS